MLVLAGYAGEVFFLSAAAISSVSEKLYHQITMVGLEMRDDIISIPSMVIW